MFACSPSKHFEPVLRLEETTKMPQNILSSKKWTTRSGLEKYILGAEDGIYVSKRGNFEKLLEFEQVVQMDLISDPPLFVALGGKTKHVRIWPLHILEGGAGWPITLDITQNCSMYALGKIEERIILGVVVKKKVLLLHLDATKRFKKLKEFNLPDACTNIKFFKDRLCASYGNKFKVFGLKQLTDTSETEFPSKSDAVLNWVSALSPALVPMSVFKIKSEYLLCYNGEIFPSSLQGECPIPHRPPFR